MLLNRTSIRWRTSFSICFKKQHQLLNCAIKHYFCVLDSKQHRRRLYCKCLRNWAAGNNNNGCKLFGGVFKSRTLLVIAWVVFKRRWHFSRTYFDDSKNQNIFLSSRRTPLQKGLIVWVTYYLANLCCWKGQFMGNISTQSQPLSSKCSIFDAVLNAIDMYVTFEIKWHSLSVPILPKSPLILAYQWGTCR